MEYLKRVIDDQLQDYLDAFGAVNIEGPKWCGKTTTAKQKAASIIELQDTDKRDEYLATALTKASLLLEGETPRLIDEWQDAPTLWDAVRVACDRRQKPSQFILTGSTSADTSETAHTGTGRIADLTMFPMSLYETGESTGEISLEALFDNPSKDISAHSKMGVEDLIFAACRGGWPAALQPKTERGKLLIAKNYVKTVCDKDISKAAKEKLDPKIARAILRSYARNISTLADKTTILADVAANNDSLARSTFDKYVAALEKLFVIQDITAWNPSIRSKTAIRSGEKRSFCDPSIAVAALGLGPGQLKTQLKTFGFIFETMCVRDLKVYSAQLGGEISHYRDRYGLDA
ncbi:MAG: ATP-binding protein, partial [Bacteroidales bacterium]|nr:ATP-binding protein [Bacteroidales bacterium]